MGSCPVVAYHLKIWVNAVQDEISYKGANIFTNGHYPIELIQSKKASLEKFHAMSQ